ncbi:MAG: hypothetical protein ACI4NO_05600 [Oxalobacter sp.]
MKKNLFLASLLVLILTACDKPSPSPAEKNPSTSTTQNSRKTVPIDSKAAAPIATDERTPPVDLKTGIPSASRKP